MRKIHRITTALLLTITLSLLGGCGNKDESLHMITTEKSTETTDEEETTTEKSELDKEIDDMAEESVQKTTEAATEADKAITIEQIRAANTGDALLVDGKSVSISKTYYGEDGECATEYEYLGFDSDGVYTQVYQNSEGYVQIYDKYNNYWYVYTGENSETVPLTLIYPEDDIASYLIETNHTNTVFSANTNDTIKDVYRIDGELVVEIDSSTDTDYYVAYTLDEDLRILEYTTYEKESNTKYCYCYTDLDAKYEFPSFVEDMKNKDYVRAVNIFYVDGDGYGSRYEVSAKYPVDFRTTTYTVYVDEECTTEWTSDYDNTDSTGLYTDLTLYLRLEQ